MSRAGAAQPAPASLKGPNHVQCLREPRRTGSLDRCRCRNTGNAILRPYGLSAHDGGVVPGIQLSTLSGAQTIVQTLNDVWVEAERLIGRPIDPLDPRYLGDD